MGLFSRRKKPEVLPPGEENILVISDIHLGEDILDDGPASLSEYIRALNRELAQFVASHRVRRVDGRPWHLVMNGDVFDFLKITDRKDSLEGKRRERDLTPAERARDLVNTPENVLWKLERVLEVHRPLFKELAAFVLDGHRLTLLEGNHDAELYFPEVRQRLRRALVELAERQHAGREPFDAAVLAARVEFQTWFLANPGRFHIEHGHQYDQTCSFEYHLAPLEKGQRTLATPLSHRAIPYVANLLGDFSTHGVEDWSVGHVAVELKKRGFRTVWTLLKLYVVVGIELVRRAGKGRRRELRGFAAQHDEKLRQLAEEAPYGLAMLRRLDALKASPIEFSVLRVLQMLYFDRLLIGAGIGLGLGTALWLDGLAAALTAVAVVGVGAAAWALSGVGRGTNVHTALEHAAERIADITGAKYVVFGHSHRPRLVKLHAAERFGSTAYYLNSGSWVTREILRGEGRTGMTYVEVTQQGAALLRWVSAEAEPVVVASARLEPEPPLERAV